MNRTHFLADKKFMQVYARWAQSQAKSDKDFFLLGLGPLLLVGVVLWLLPSWLGTLGALVLAVPALCVAFIVLRSYAIRRTKK